jgi:hypothetical protein|tara:strand:+ start:127 stop:339 length:213 start_codon:yes stop_codon:yes gene_type:complete
MSVKPTAATTYAELIRHETECAERWKHSFKQLDKLDLAIARLQWWIIGGVTTVCVGLFSTIVTFVIRSNL